MEQLLQLLKEIGFETVAELDIATLKALPEIRKMCEVNTCGAYNTTWTCPPGCGTVEECAEIIKRYQNGILVQTVGDIEDSFDWEGITEVKETHRQRFLKGAGLMREKLDQVLPLGDGTCHNCETCTYPDEPCRFPERAIASMEAYGLFVSDVCRKNGILYNYGPDKMCYTGCYLF